MGIQPGPVTFLLHKDLSRAEAKAFIHSKSFNLKDNVFFDDLSFSSNRSALIANLRSAKQADIVMCCYDYGYMRWKLVYEVLLFIFARRLFVFDTKGYEKIVTFRHIAKTVFMSFTSTISQICCLISSYLFTSTFKDLTASKLNKKNEYKVAYLRTTEAFNLRMGGSLGHTVGVVRALEEFGDVTYFGIDHINSLPSTTQVIVRPTTLSTYVSIFNRFDYSFRFSKKVRESVNDYDFIYQRLSRDNLSGLMLKKYKDIPLVVEFNSFIEWELSGGRANLNTVFSKASDRIERLSLRNADLILSVSQPLTDQLISKGYNPNKILTSPNAVDSRRFHPVRDNHSVSRVQLGIDEDSVVVGFSGTFSFWHGINVLAEAAKALVKHSNIHFMFIGMGPLVPDLKKHLKGSKKVTFVGQVDYELMPDYLAICDILLSPHLKPESGPFIGSPTKLFEYMSMEKVLIASDLDQISEIVSPAIKGADLSRDGVLCYGDACGILVSPGSVSELCRAVSTVADNLDRYKYLAVNARVRAINCLSWDNLARKIINKLESDSRL